MTAPQPSRLMVLLFTDIVGSVDLKTRLGAAAASGLIARHDELFRSVVEPIAGSSINKDTGDGFLASFATASDAVEASLLFQLALHAEPWQPEPLTVRMGLHIGEVTELGPEPGGQPKLSGLAVDLAARIMELAQPGQLLMTRAAFDDARQFVRQHPVLPGGLGDDQTPQLKWMDHGPYVFKGIDAPMVICEVGAVGHAPLRPPADSAKAQRSVALADEETLGWRPAAGQSIPHRQGWTLDHKLGEGGFGEVWLAVNQQTRSRRVFKFCFDGDRLRSLKRELTLFRLLRDTLGDRRDIAKLHEVQLEHPPFYLESEFTEGGSLPEWAAKQGGIDRIPLGQRVSLMTQTARAVSAAHSVGILHKDVKPANVLIYEDDEGEIRPQLADFGIGALTDTDGLSQHNITMTGFTEAVSGQTADTATTRMYAPPELLAGHTFTVLGDVYALGVMLYQMVVGDLDRPLAQGWEQDVPDPLLREDIAACVEGHVEQRLGSAHALAGRLESLETRRVQVRRRRLGRLAALASLLLLGLLAIALSVVGREMHLRKKAVQQAEYAQQVTEFLTGMFLSVDPYGEHGPNVRVVDMLDTAAADIPRKLDGQPWVQAQLQTTLGQVYKHLGLPERALTQLRSALDIRRQTLPPEHPDLADSLHELGAALWFDKQYAQAAAHYEEALALRRKHHRSDHGDVAITLQHYAASLDKLERHDQAQMFFGEALEMWRRLQNPIGEMQTLNGLGVSLRDQGRFEEAIPLLEQAMQQTADLLGEERAPVSVVMFNLAVLYERAGDLDKAETLCARAVAIREKELRSGDPRRIEASKLLESIRARQ